MASRSKLGTCTSCGGFIPARAESCVHCNTATRPLFERLRIGALGGAFGGGAIAFTLMACYGMPPCDDGTRGCYDVDTDAGTTDSDAASDATRPDVHVRDASAHDAADADADASPEDAGPDAPDAEP